MREILERAWSGKEIEICSGADDICRECPHLENEKCCFDKNSDNEIRNMDRRAIKLLRLSAHGRVQWSKIGEKIPQIIKAWTDTYCKTCIWRKACEAKFRNL
jgi:hypothetical protein